MNSTPKRSLSHGSSPTVSTNLSSSPLPSSSPKSTQQENFHHCWSEASDGEILESPADWHSAKRNVRTARMSEVPPIPSVVEMDWKGPRRRQSEPSLSPRVQELSTKHRSRSRRIRRELSSTIEVFDVALHQSDAVGNRPGGGGIFDILSDSSSLSSDESTDTCLLPGSTSDVSLAEENSEAAPSSSRRHPQKRKPSSGMGRGGTSFQLSRNEIPSWTDEDVWLRQHVLRLHRRRLPPRPSVMHSNSQEGLTFRRVSPRDLLDRSSSEPTLVVDFYRWPGWLRRYGASRREEAYVRAPLEMMMDDPILYLEISPEDPVEGEDWMDGFSNSFEFEPSPRPGSTFSAPSPPDESVNSIPPGPSLFEFEPFKEGTLRFNLSRGSCYQFGTTPWRIRLVPTGIGRKIKLEGPELTVIIHERRQTSQESLFHFDLLLESLTLWQCLQWDPNNIPFIHSVTYHLRNAEAVRNDFNVFVIRILRENLRKMNKECYDHPPWRSKRTNQTGFEQRYLHHLADPTHPLGPTFSILDWIWAESHMAYPKISLQGISLYDHLSEGLLKHEVEKRTKYQLQRWISKRLQSTRLLLTSILMTAYSGTIAILQEMLSKTKARYMCRLLLSNRWSQYRDFLIRESRVTTRRLTGNDVNQTQISTVRDPKTLRPHRDSKDDHLPRYHDPSCQSRTTPWSIGVPAYTEFAASARNPPERDVEQSGRTVTVPRDVMERWQASGSRSQPSPRAHSPVETLSAEMSLDRPSFVEPLLGPRHRSSPSDSVSFANIDPDCSPDPHAEQTTGPEELSVWLS